MVRLVLGSAAVFTTWVRHALTLSPELGVVNRSCCQLFPKFFYLGLLVFYLLLECFQNFGHCIGQLLQRSASFLTVSQLPDVFDGHAKCRGGG